MARPLDTSQEAYEMMKKLWRSLTPEQKLRKCSEMFVMGKYLILARLRYFHPDATPREFMIMLFRELFKGDLSDEIIEDVVHRIRTMPFLPKWREFLGIDENVEVD